MSKVGHLIVMSVVILISIYAIFDAYISFKEITDANSVYIILQGFTGLTSLFICIIELPSAIKEVYKE